MAASVTTTYRAVSREQWITPKEQLARLTPDIAGVVANTCLGGVEDLGKIVAEYLPREGDICTRWYTSLERLRALPEKIPPLPDNILPILSEPCPVSEDGRTVGATHILTLVPEELGTINQIEDLVRQYGQQRKPGGENPLQFSSFRPGFREQYGNAPPEPTHWELMTKNVLSGSQGQDYETQVEKIVDLSEKALVNYKAANLRGTIASTFLHEVATEEKLLSRDLRIYTHVQEMVEGANLVVGGFSRDGLVVGRVIGYVGILARRKF